MNLEEPYIRETNDAVKKAFIYTIPAKITAVTFRK